MAWEPKNNYLQQLKFISKQVMDFIELLLADAKRQPVIILQSDHGSFIQDKDPLNVYNARSRILNAYYVQDSLKNAYIQLLLLLTHSVLFFPNYSKQIFPCLKTGRLTIQALKMILLSKIITNSFTAAIL